MKLRISQEMNWEIANIKRIYCYFAFIHDFTCSFLEKDTEVSKGHSSNFTFLMGTCLLISVSYLAG